METIGDAYVVCSGVPVPMENHATEMAMCALHLVNISANLKVAHKPQHHFLMRIGLHCGKIGDMIGIEVSMIGIEVYCGKIGDMIGIEVYCGKIGDMIGIG